MHKSEKTQLRKCDFAQNRISNSFINIKRLINDYLSLN